jgi:hypothetical protein
VFAWVALQAGKHLEPEPKAKDSRFPGALQVCLEATYAALQSLYALLKSGLLNFPGFGYNLFTGLRGAELFENLGNLLLGFCQAVTYDNNRRG